MEPPNGDDPDSAHAFPAEQPLPTLPQETGAPQQTRAAQGDAQPLTTKQPLETGYTLAASQPLAAGYSHPSEYPHSQPGPRPPGPFTLTLSALWFTQWKAWSGRPLEAREYTNRVVASTGNRWVTWLTTVLLNSVLIALVYVASSSTSLLYGVGWSLSGYSEYSAGVYGPSGAATLLSFLLVTALCIAAYVFRGLGLWWSLRAAGSSARFNEVMTLYSSAKMLVWFPLAILALFTLTRAFIVLAFLAPWVIFIAIAVVVLSQITLFLAAQQEVVGLPTADGERASAFRWYLLFSAGAIFGYCGTAIGAVTLSPILTVLAW